MTPLVTEETPTLGAPPQSNAPAAEVPAQSRGERVRSFDPDDFPLPTGREEEWRFTPIDRLSELLEGVEPTGALSLAMSLPDGVTSSAADPDHRDSGVQPPGDRASVVAVRHARESRLVSVAAETVVEEPIRIGVTGSAGQRTFEHLVLRAGRHSKATIVMEHSGDGQHSQAVSVVAEDGCDLTVVSIQEWDDDAIHLAEHTIHVGRDATVRHIVVTLGGGLVRIVTNVTYAGPGGSFEGLGVYLADSEQHLEHRLLVDHEPPRCASHVTYKGALSGRTAHTVWVGDVLIRAAAEGTDTYELNRNLILTQGARADSVPNLEIETGEIIGAGHASATGRFDDEQLFYLQSRGIPEDQARRLVVHGFFADIINRIGVTEVADRLMHAVDAQLNVSTDSPGADAVNDVVTEAVGESTGDAGLGESSADAGPDVAAEGAGSEGQA